jgi:hypothetical protein
MQTFSTCQEKQNVVSHNEIGDTSKIENLTLKMEIPLEEILPSDVCLYE